jgi:hypothetical protein
MKKIILLSLFLSLDCLAASGYTNELTGAFLPSAWSSETNGLIARLCTNKKIIKSGGGTPTFLLEIKNVSKQNIPIKDLLNSEMLLFIKPQKVLFTSADVLWVFDEARLSSPLKSNEVIRAVCKLPMRLVPTLGKFTFSMEINRGVYPPNSCGIPARPNSWTGILVLPAVEIDYDVTILNEESNTEEIHPIYK